MRNNGKHARRSLAVRIAIALGAMASVMLGFGPAQASATAHKPACKVTVVFTETHRGQTHPDIRISGDCFGRAPTAGRMQQLAKDLVVPEWMHFYQEHMHSWIVCGGNCGTSALVNDRGQAFTS